MNFNDRLKLLEIQNRMVPQPSGKGRTWIIDIIKQTGVVPRKGEAIVDIYCRAVGTTRTEFQQQLRKKAGC